MTVSSQISKAGPYNGNSVLRDFPFSFQIFTDTDIRVVSTDADGVDTVLDVSAYSVTVNADQNTSPGGSVLVFTAPALTTKITILRDLDLTQGAALQNQGGFYPKVIENALDKLTMLIQQVSEELGRAIKLSVSSDGTQDITDLLAIAQAAVDEAQAAAATANSAVGLASASELAAAASAIAAAASAIAAAASAAEAAAPTTAAMAAYLDDYFPGTPVELAEIYVSGGFDLGAVDGGAPFQNEVVARRVLLSSGTGAFDFGTLF